MRDFETEPFSKDEERVVKFIDEESDYVLGAGEDPIGFILSSYLYIRFKNNRLKEVLEIIRENIENDQDISNDKKSFILGLMAGALGIDRSLIDTLFTDKKRNEVMKKIRYSEGE